MKFVLPLIIYFLILGCSAPVIEPVKVTVTEQKIDYIADVKPIFDNRCVSCHSCYNSPCQTKFSSFEGIDRGGSKIAVYDAARLRGIQPTRLFTDAKSTDEWHKKGFFSITTSDKSTENTNDSIMMHMLHEKNNNPQVIGSYEPEKDELICPKNKEELNEYMDEKEHHGMPYGFPALKNTEYETLAQWIHRGAKGPTTQQQIKLQSPSKLAAIEIEKLETFLNIPDAKYAVTSRYLYEHFFLAHLNFKSAPKEFYKLVRSRTPSPQKIDSIATLRPYDDPKIDKFYYRIEKIHSTIVHKTHMVVEFDDKKLARFKELFITPKWIEEPHYIGYDTKTSANPFIAFYQIPASSRYKFLLDHSHYIFMTFIRGPVCRGQMALNVIHDQFWVMFADPKFDITLNNPEFLKSQFNNLSLPIESSNNALLKTFSDQYKDKYKAYFFAKEELYNKVYPEGLDIQSIWKGETAQDAPLLTVYRHFDSASVHKGVLGNEPRTTWVVDYPQFERIYYTLVAGYDVFGNLSHQTNVRRYTDFLRMEGELNFISYMPHDSRLEMFKSWYINDNEIEKLDNENTLQKRATKVQYKTKYYKNEFIENVVQNHIRKDTNIAFDTINYHKIGAEVPKMPKEFHTLEDLKNGARALTLPGTGFITHVTDNEMNTILVKIVLKDGSTVVRTMVINRWHDNVNSLFNGEQNNPQKDTIDILKGSVGSYPNMFAHVDEENLPDFFDLLENFDGSDKHKLRLKKYFIGRDDKQFWEIFDWFQNDFNKSDPIHSGLYDLNRYYRNGFSSFKND